jgi:hypothetical protein
MSCFNFERFVRDGVQLGRAGRLDRRPPGMSISPGADRVLISAHYHRFGGARRRRVGSGRRIIRNELNSPNEAGQERNDQRDLKAKRSCVGVDADDLVLDLVGLAGEELLELGVGHQFGVILKHVGDALLLGARTVLGPAMLAR